RLHMHSGDTHQIGAFALVELIEVGLVLEEVGIQTLFRHLDVGLHIVGEHSDLQVDPFLGQFGLHKLQDFRVGNRSGGNAEFLVGLGGGGEERGGQGQHSS